MESDRDAELDSLRGEIRQLAAAAERQDTTLAEFRAVLDSLLQILQAGKLLDEGHLRWIDKLRRRAKVVSEPQLALDSTDDKYAVANADVDCASRLHLCHGRCCSFNIRLSEQDLREGQLEWRIREPYLLAQTERGYCVHQTESTGFCGKHEVRPAVCRAYDCRDDRRVWLDFEQMIPAPMPPGLVTIRRSPKVPE